MGLVVAKQLTDAWFAARSGKITASICAAILGLDPHRGPISAYSQIVRGKPLATNSHMARGTAFEPHARDAYECESGKLVTETGFWLHDDFPWLGGSPDGLIGKDGMCEIKCPQVLPSVVPVHHLIQMDVQLACTNREWCDYYAWTQGGTFRYRYKRDRATEANLIARLQLFYETHVVPKIPPSKRRRLPKSDTNGNGPIE